MAEISSLEDLRKKRLRYVESARENDFEEGLKSLLSELYPDNAHFIYELLQNAEDALASTVKFSLADDRLTVSHDGKRPFSIADIDSITGIGKSTKKDDPTQIGKFGVGFKAVFAYTTRPEVRSGEHSFAIEDLFVPTEISGTAKPGLTTFVFPFDRTDKPTEMARQEVERGLTDLDEKTLLFLNHIRTVTYDLPDGSVGSIQRTPVDDQIITITRAEREDLVESNWLRLTGRASMDGAVARPLTVAAAFKLEITDRQSSKKAKQGDSQSSAVRRSIVPLDEGDVSIYFPAAKESSGLRFHIHAPFASTVARDSVQDDPGNVRLVGDIARLVTEALPGLCAKGLIDDNFLATLPNEDDQIGHPYDLIRGSITDAFNDLDISPVRGTGAGYAAAKTLVSSPSEFRNWLDPADLPTLFEFARIETDSPPRWIRDRDGRAGKFLTGLDTIEFGWEELSTAIRNQGQVDTYQGDQGDQAQQSSLNVWLRWIEAKSDEALVRLYQLLGLGVRKGELWTSLYDVPIVRLNKRTRQQHVKGHETFLPATRSDAVQSRVPVNLAYFDDDEDVTRTANLTAFYRAVGTKRWDQSARLEQRLAAYRGSNRPIPEGDDIAQHLDDVRSFIRYAASNQRTAPTNFSNVPFLLAEQSQGHPRWVTPRQTFVDLPFLETGLSAMYPRVPLHWRDGGGYAYDREPYPLAGLYLDVDGIVEFLATLGAQTGLEIIKADVTTNRDFSPSWRQHHRQTASGQRVDWSIDRLDDIIGTGQHDLLRTLWEAVVAAPASKALACYQVNGSAMRHQLMSQAAQALTATPWILNREGDLKLPRQVIIDDLPEDWQLPEPGSLIYKLGFGADAAHRRQKQEGVAQFLREEGLDEDSIDLLREVKELGLTSDDLRGLLREHTTMAQFADAASEDPVRRAGVAALDAITAPEHTTSVRPRSVVEGQRQVSAETRTYLRSQYTTPTGEMHCQACRKPLPFKTKDGHWYFEAVRFVTARKRVHTSNAVALCPLCAALFQYARETKNEAILEQLANITIEAGQGTVDVPVVLDGKRVKVTFTGKHAIDIKSSLGAAGEERSGDA